MNNAKQNKQMDSGPFNSSLIDKNGMLQYLPGINTTSKLPKLTCPAGFPKHLVKTELEMIDETILDKNVKEMLHHKPTLFSCARQCNLNDMLDGQLSESGISLDVDRDMISGSIIDIRERELDNSGINSSNSMSMKRQMDRDACQDVRGTRSNLPFWPGGMPMPEERKTPQRESMESMEFAEVDLLSTPVGFSLDLTDEMKALERNHDDDPDAAFDLNRIVLGETFNSTASVLELGVAKEGGDRVGNNIMDGEEDYINTLNLDLAALLINKKKSGTTKQTDLANAGKAQVGVTSSSAEGGVASSNTPVVNILKSSKKQQLDEKGEVVDKTLLKPQNKLYSSVDEVITLDNIGSQVVWTGEDHEYAIVLDCETQMPPIEKLVDDSAFKFEFPLDTFQKQAILCLERNQNVFVSAHTSAGKTVVAEYAIALTMRRMTKTIYTSPIKALSNQKYRDFKDTFGDVGLVTGDVQVDPRSSCLIMTTEILRSMLYNGSDVIRDLEFVVFDEVHYINNEERGVVWEEVLIMLPSHIKLIMLSATVPNTVEFASWVGRTKQKPVFCVSTAKRPVPLEHFLYTGHNKETENNLFSIVTKEDKFNVMSYNQAISSTAIQKPRMGRVNDVPYWKSLIKTLLKKKLNPAVFFIFSRARIDSLARNICSIQICTSEESKESVSFFNTKVLRILSKSDQGLPQVINMLNMVKNGYGIHHSGVLPILKEAVEFLFCKGNIKVLLATETFAMGINMPAKCVVFDSISKHDGTSKRLLLAGEFVQMAGRAGRRGIDTIGSVIVMCKPMVPAELEIRQVIMGEATHLKSQFRLTYSMIMNLIRVENLHIEDMMKRSFAEYANQKNITKNEKRLIDIKKTLADMKCKDVSMCDFNYYYSLCKEIYHKQQRIMEYMFANPPRHFLEIGQVILVRTTVAIENTYKADLSKNKKWTKRKSALTRQQLKINCGLTSTATQLTEAEKHLDYFDEHFLSPAVVTEGMLSLGFTVLMPAEGGQSCAGGFFYTPNATSQPKLQLINKEDIYAVTNKFIKINSTNLMNSCKSYLNDISRRMGEPMLEVYQQLVTWCQQHKETGIPLVYGHEDKKDVKLERYQEIEQLKIYKAQLASSFPDQNNMDFRNKFREISRREELKQTQADLEYLSSDESLVLLPEMKIRIKVLIDLNYFENLTSIQLKGRVACEITSEEFILSAVIFDGIFNDLNPVEIASVLSGVIHHKKKAHEEPVDVTTMNISEKLKKAIEHCNDLAKRLAIVQKKHQLEITQFDNYEDLFNFELVEVVYNWTKGDMTFAEIMTCTNIQEGIIVRVIQRINELLTDLKKAGTLFGDPTLVTNVNEAIRLIKRDIVFAASLYL